MHTHTRDFRAASIVTLIAIGTGLACAAQVATEGPHLPGRSHYQAPHAAVAPRIDGRQDDEAWRNAEWRDVEYRWLGPEFSSEDFSARYKVVWTQDRLFILVELVDDVLIDSHRDPLQQYWDDDCMEIFLDEDYSGGNHQYSHNAFAYHVSLDNRSVDIGPDRKPHDYSQHVDSQWKQLPEGVVWEFAISVYGDDYEDGGDNTPLRLSAGKFLGLMIAYCDNDGSAIRENFIGSESVPEGAKDRGWIDAGLFGKLELLR